MKINIRILIINSILLSMYNRLEVRTVKNRKLWLEINLNIDF